MGAGLGLRVSGLIRASTLIRSGFWDLGFAVSALGVLHHLDVAAWGL